MLPTHITEPFFTIFSAGRSCERFARRHIESVLAQDFPSFQHVIVDDASPDGTWKVIDSALTAASHDARIWRFRRPHRHFKLANFLDYWPCMKGQVIVELDLDDRFAHDRVLSRLHRIYTQHPRTDATAGSCQTDLIGGMAGHPGPHVPRPRIFNIMFAIDYPAPRTWRRSLTLQQFAECAASFYDPATSEPWLSSADYALYAPAVAWARYIHPIDEILVNVYRHNGTAHDYAEFPVEQLACARGIRSYWDSYTARTQGEIRYA